MIPGDQKQAEMQATEAEEADAVTDAESHDDDAWMEACRAETTDDEDPLTAETAVTDPEQDDFESPHRSSETGENEADLTDSSASGTAIEKTGDDAMSKFGHAIGALAESDEDLDDRALDYAAEMASPSTPRDAAVAPHIAAAERELERAKSSGPVDIFDRIAQAAESQFDETRGSTAKRVSELVDDRRVGTKRWTPSKTMKQRMEKLEAARAAADGSSAVKAPAAEVEAPDVAAAAAVAATAPASSEAEMVSPTAEAKPVVEEAPAAPMTEDQNITISRRDRHSDAADSATTESAGASEAVAEDEEELDADGLRIVPGARGRRRDRARKSRLDEDFEKIFDDEGKPSINSLRRKLRSSAASEAAEGEAVAGVASVTEEHFGAEPEEAPKKGLFARLLGKNKSAKAVDAADEFDEDEVVAAFEADETAPTDTLDFETSENDDWQTAVDNERKQRAIAMPIIGAGAAIAFGGIGWFAYKFLFGG